jgi:uncharacterized membrane protein
MTITIHEGTLHRWFLISVWIKGIAGLLETIAGLLCVFITPGVLNVLVVSLTAPELAEDPHDWIATGISRAVQQLSPDTTRFAAAYLVIHGLIKLCLVGAYPTALSFLTGFIVYQGYRYMHTHSIALILLTGFDVIVAFLIWREYQSRKHVIGS